MKLFRALGLLTAGLVFSASYANANTTLAALVANGGSLTIGDKTFSNFSYTESGLTSFDASQITVSVSAIGNVDYLTWGGNISVATLGFATGDLLLNYSVTASAGLITSIDQNYTGGVGSGIGSVSIVENVRSPAVNNGSSVVATSSLSLHDTSDPSWELSSDQPYITPGQAVLHVTNDIGLGAFADANDPVGFVTISEIQQSFHQSAVPDGGMTLGLLGLTMLGCQCLRRKLAK